MRAWFGRGVVLSAGIFLFLGSTAQAAIDRAGALFERPALQSLDSKLTAAGASGYQIEVRFPDATLTPSQQLIFQTAANRWQTIVTGELSDVNVDGVIVDDLRIDATAPAIDGVGGILGQAGPEFIRNSNFLPVTGIMQFDSADLTALEENGSLLNVILHEMGHVMGLGSLWDLKGLITGAGGSDPRYTGANALAEYNAIFGVNDTSIPVENTGSPGTRDAHWRESVFDNELMTGFLDAGSNPLSRISAAQFMDLGYPGVVLNSADIYFPPGVPEPTGMALLMTAGLALGRRQRAK